MRKLLVIWLLIGCFCAAQAQDAGSRLVIGKISPEGIALDKNWKFHVGDDIQWAKTNYNDSDWTVLNLSDPAPSFLAKTNGNICWLRLHISFDTTIANLPLSLLIRQYGASEVYVDGQLRQQYGRITTQKVVPFNPQNQPLPVDFSRQQDHVLTIRFICPPPSAVWFLNMPTIPPFSIRLQPIDTVISSLQKEQQAERVSFAVIGVLSVFALLFLFIYFFYKRQLLNLFFSIHYFSAALVMYILWYLQHGQQFGLTGYAWLEAGRGFFTRMAGFSVLTFILLALYHRIHPLMKWYLAYIPLSMFFIPLLPPGFGYLDIGHRFTDMLFMLYLGIVAFRRAHLKEWFIGILSFASFLVNVSFFLFFFWGIESSVGTLIYNFGLLPSMIIYLSLNYVQLNKSLEQQLVQVKVLSEENLRKEQEKQVILSQQNEMLEQQVTERTAALNHSLEELRSTQAQLIQREKMASLGELTAGIAHEIQNPLNFINNFSEVNKELLQEWREEQQKQERSEEITIDLLADVEQNTEKILLHGKRADSIVKSMLQHSRTSSGEKQPTDLNALADEYLRLSYHGMRVKDHSFNPVIEGNYDKSLGMINIVPQEIGQVLLNLLNNAFYAVQEKSRLLNGNFQPTVKLTTKKENNSAVVIVKDNGTGISQKIKEKIFQPFFTTKPTGEGTGLGLSLSYDIVKAHGGELKVVSKEKEGSEFTVELPVV
jgi:signal transduction histidine kinase